MNAPVDSVDPGWRDRFRIGLRARIAIGVLLAVLIPSVVISAIAYNRLAHTATVQFRQQARDETLSDLYSASVAAQLMQPPLEVLNGTVPDGSAGVTPDLSQAFTGSFQNFFLPTKHYAVVVLKPGANGQYSFTRNGPGDSGNLHTIMSPAVIEATPFTKFVSDYVHPVSLRIDVDGKRWFAVGGVTATGSSASLKNAPVVAVDYYDLARLDAQISGYRTSLITLSGVVIVFAVLVAWLVAGRIQRPVSVAADAARRFGQGERQVRLPVNGRDQMARLSRSFNTMADRLSGTVEALEASDRKQRQFVADVSHELRTPMTTLVAAAAALDDPTTRDRAAILVAPQLRRLTRLTEDLIEISLLDSGTLRIDPEPVDVAALCVDLVSHTAEPSAYTVHASGDTSAQVDLRRLRSIVGNLLDNATVHGRAPVTVTVTGDVDSVSLTVADQGPGVPDELRQRVFDRFVRADPSRTGPLNGSGLGLALALDNATLLHGQLTIEVSDDPGAIFRLVIPRDQPWPAES
jgi:two-component system, OmpR family, sensor histidine kinase MtrB